MALDPEKLQRPFRQLQKSLKKMPRRPSPEEVHDLRTRSRRLESVMHALALDQQSAGQRLLKNIAPIRKSAGRVRDMDVLTSFAATLEPKGDEQSLVQLLEHLGQRRLRSVRKLSDTIAKKEKKARTGLKRYSDLLDKQLGASKNGSKNNEWPADAAAVALQLSSELARWPELRSGNLHPYRLKVKELRYVLQLAKDNDAKFITALGDVKDAIGEWHDWTELARLARKALDQGSRSKVLKEVDSTARTKFDRAMTLAQHMRKQYLDTAKDGRARSPQRKIQLKQQTISPAVKLAA